MNWTMAMIRDPKAIEPRWYLKIHWNPSFSDALPPAMSPWCEKYQVEAAAAMIN